MYDTNALLPDKEYYSTGELAAACHVTKHTIITAIEKSDLRASQTPGGHNRIPREEAMRFLKKHNIISQDNDNFKILVVDDEDFVYGIMAQLYSDANYEITHAVSGYEAGKLAERIRPDLILLDIKLPDIDGREVCRHIREEDFGKHCAILAVSAIRDPKQIEDIRRAGIDDYLAKPFTVDSLQEKVNSFMSVFK
jgi:excisionase family DNA binding protein